MSSRNAALPGKAHDASQNQAGCWDLGAVIVTNYAMATLTGPLSHTYPGKFSVLFLLFGCLKHPRKHRERSSQTALR